MRDESLPHFSLGIQDLFGDNRCKRQLDSTHGWEAQETILGTVRTHRLPEYLLSF